MGLGVDLERRALVAGRQVNGEVGHAQNGPITRTCHTLAPQQRVVVGVGTQTGNEPGKSDQAVLKLVLAGSDHDSAGHG